MSRTDCQRETIARVAQLILAAGYRVFLAKSGTYGFYTDREGTRVVSFQTGLGVVPVSGNYVTDNPRSTGTGWRMVDNFDPAKIDAYFKAEPPIWAVKRANLVQLTTLEQHLGRYQPSSKYEEIYA